MLIVTDPQRRELRRHHGALRWRQVPPVEVERDHIVERGAVRADEVPALHADAGRRTGLNAVAPVEHEAAMQHHGLQLPLVPDRGRKLRLLLGAHHGKQRREWMEWRPWRPGRQEEGLGELRRHRAALGRMSSGTSNKPWRPVHGTGLASRQ